MSNNANSQIIEKDMVLHNRYSIIKKIGEGGMGEVYLAFDQRTSHEVAIKLLRTALASTDENRERFIQESKLCSQIKHKNVVKVVDSFFHGEFPCFAMEYVKGSSLRNLLDEKKGMEVTIPVIIDTLDAIYSAHKLSIIHRDLKPANILVTEDGIVKVSDWGIATATNDPTGMTKTGMIIGTPDYIAPERITEGKSLPQSDIYSIGCILYEILCGHPPFTGSLAQIITAQIKSPPSIPLHLGSEMKRFIGKLLEKDASLRPGNAMNVRNELQAIYERMLSSPSREAKTLCFKGPELSENIVKTDGRKASNIRKKAAIAFVILLFICLLFINLDFSGKKFEKNTLFQEGHIEVLITKVHAVDFNTIEIRYDSKLCGEYTYEIYAGNKMEEGLLNFKDSPLSGGRLCSMQIHLKQNYYEDITLKLTTEPKTSYQISMKPCYDKNFKVLSNISDFELMELFKKLDEMSRYTAASEEKDYYELLDSCGFNKNLLDKLAVLIPRYFRYIDYDNNLYSEQIDILKPLREISCFLSYQSIHPVFGLTSSLMDVRFFDHQNHPPKEALEWNTMAEFMLSKYDSDGKLHYPILFYEFEKIKDKASLFQLTERTGLLASMAFETKTALDYKDLTGSCKVPVKTWGKFNPKEKWPPAKARIDVIFLSYDLDNYFSITVNGHKPVHCLKTWRFTPVIGKRVVISVPIPISWLKNDMNILTFTPQRLTKCKGQDIFQTLLENVRLRVQFN
jgi:serine/threonine protein kinase